MKLLAICGSPRRDSNSQILLDLAVEGAKSAGNVEVEHYTF
ncbi:MAG TPA: NAD(P)H-dependent oxidoreductase, partial [Candidatus Aphodomorpha intestinavium]|nr:NAD(P)H-dependent oxidoreductase [Candidatus Aphodomorpha intestinavium]